MGGFHLAGADVVSRVDATVHDLAQISPDYLITGHCTGFKAQAQLSQQFGDRHIPYGVGTVFRFTGEIL
jgi:7,8-dihydropterin-6-yl-methyl-4-(beta-D-ribofuranosyl)aminobenzene 5'-phosphate synthase